MEKPNLFVTAVDLTIADKLKSDLVSQGFEISNPQYTVFSAKKKGLSCTLYESGKLMVQGKDTAQFMEFYLEPEILKSFNYSYGELDLDLTQRIGIDEAGKGDVFGALCVAGVCAGGDEILALKKLGVRDSKLINDAEILRIGNQIQKTCKTHVLKLYPSKYNELYEKFANLNSLLAWGHATVIGQLVADTGCKEVIIDQFAAERVVIQALKRKELEVDLTQRTKGEEDIVVAAASILARQAFLESISALSREFEINLPKGAAAITIKIGRHFVAKHGRENMGKVAKLHFKTVTTILQ